jgi:hypothetical protein
VSNAPEAQPDGTTSVLQRLAEIFLEVSDDLTALQINELSARRAYKVLANEVRLWRQMHDRGEDHLLDKINQARERTDDDSTADFALRNPDPEETTQ